MLLLNRHALFSKSFTILTIMCLCTNAQALPMQSVAPQSVAIIGGSYRPLYLSPNSPMVDVDSFFIDNLPVTNQQYYDFVQKNPKWQKQNIAELFAEKDYLKHWKKHNNTFAPSQHDLNKPVTNVSWYAAQSYCKAQNKRLPTVAEWEYVAAASEKNKIGSTEAGYNQKILNWYSQSGTRPLMNVGQQSPNFWGVHDMHGLIWEWTYDFNNSMVTGESRADSSLNKEMFCGSGAAGAADPSDYAAFMRYGFRASLQSPFTLASLGFRCASAD